MAKKSLHPEPYTTVELEELLGVALKQETLFSDRPAAAKVLEVNNSFKCLDRALHVYGEADRVWKFREVCEGNSDHKLEELGALMYASHQSCDKLYECSCEQLNELVAIAMCE